MCVCVYVYIVSNIYIYTVMCVYRLLTHSDRVYYTLLTQYMIDSHSLICRL